MIVFQDLIAKLTRFWADQGCIVHQGHDVESGAGTFNPATFMRSLGPEPYSTVYVEPSRRPQDARFGENPNRVHLFHQLQVIIKPSPVDIQKIYLDSLRVVGIDPKKHDIRFVHDDWESPTLGASGLGWEVWMDGMEITQFTYFQMVGGFELPVVPVEITYGLERLCMYLQNVDSIFKIKWNDTLTFAEIAHRSEVEWSQYGFEEAKVEMWLRHFDDYEEESKRLIDIGLPLPAYDFVLKASHAFNILESRGMLSVTERTGYLARSRALSPLCGKSYPETREKLQYPLLKEKEEKPYELPQVEKVKADPSKKETLLLEIGSEELPAGYVLIGLLSFEKLMRALLEKVGLTYGNVHIFGTPRRLAVLIEDVPLGTPASSETKKGPAVSFAFDENGELTGGGRGFFKKLGLTDIRLTDVQAGKHAQVAIGGNHLMIQLEQEEKSSIDLIKDELAALIESIHFPKTMHWSDKTISYARPIHSLLAMHGAHYIPFHLDGVASGKTTFGHAQRGNPKIEIGNAADYAETLKKHSVLACEKERKEMILEQISSLEKSSGCKVVSQAEVLKEVLYLSEYPQLCIGSFNPEFLSVPKQVLVEVMIKHQRYFPLLDSSGNLSAKFIITADNDPCPEIIEGNERVIAARFADAQFLYGEDCKKKLSDFAKGLKNLTFHKEIGSVADKVERVEALVMALNNFVPCDLSNAKLAASLCKADLMSALVNEFPTLQGVIGRHYAEIEGLDGDVALAIEEHYLPRFEGDVLPTSKTGTLLSLSDKCDTLRSIASIGALPTSSNDPYAMRRTAIAILRILIEKGIDLDLSEIFNADTLEFLIKRLRVLLVSYELSKTEIAATISDHCKSPYDGYLRAKALSEVRKKQNFDNLREVYKRAKGQLAKDTPASTIDPSLFQVDAEKALFQHYETMQKQWSVALGSKNYAECFQLLANMQKPLSDLFETVRILDDNLEIRANRLALIKVIFTVFESFVDLSLV